MIRSFLPILFLLIGLVNTVLVHATESSLDMPIQWQPWSEDIFNQAQNKNKLVILGLVAEWCQFCKKMDATTYKDTKVIESIQNNYIAIRVDRDKNKYLDQRYAQDGTPATIIFNSEGIELIKRRGYIPPQFMYWMLEAVANNPQPDAHK